MSPGYGTSIIVSIDNEFWYDVDELTGAGTFSTHNQDGEPLYVADIAVHPDYQGRGHTLPGLRNGNRPLGLVHRGDAIIHIAHLDRLKKFNTTIEEFRMEISDDS